MNSDDMEHKTTVDGRIQVDEEGRLWLSQVNLSEQECRTVAQLIATTDQIKDLQLADSLVSGNRLGILLQSLESSSSVTSVNLSGNVLDGADVWGKLSSSVSKNRILRSLDLSCCNLGADAEAFATFCYSLQLNSSLQRLDLRHNQLSPSMGVILAGCLKTNCSIKWLHLGWNSLGASGGHAMLSMLRHNCTLTELMLDANHVPLDTLSAIQICVQNNATILTMTCGLAGQTRRFNTTLAQIKDDYQEQLANLQSGYVQLEQKASDISFEKGRLLETKDQLQAEVSQLKAQLSISQKALAVAEDQLGRLLDKEKGHLDQLHGLQLDFLEQQRSMAQAHSQELADLEQSLRASLAQIQALSSSQQLHLQQIEALKSGKEQLEARVASLQEQLQEAKDENAARISELLVQHDQVVNQLREHHQRERAALQDEIHSQLDRCQKDKQQIRSEESEQRLKELQDAEARKEADEKLLQTQIQCLKEERRRCEQICQDRLQAECDLKQALITLRSEHEALKLEHSQLTEKCSRSQQDQLSAGEKMRQQFAQRLQEASQEREELLRVREENERLRQQLDEIKARETKLAGQVERQQITMDSMRRAEAARAENLLFTIQAFVSGTKLDEE